MITNDLEEEKRRSAKGDLRWVVLGALVILVPASVAGVFAAMAIIQQWHQARCPAHTFFVGLAAAGVMPLLLLEVVLFSLGTLALASVTVWSGADGWWDQRAALTEEVSLKAIRAGAGWVAGLGAAVFVLCLPLSLFLQTCLSPAGIDTQNLPWGGLRRHAWSEVTLVETQCRYGKGGWTDDVILHIGDGQRFSLAAMTASGPWTAAYPGIRQALHGSDFIFDPSQVSARCDVPELNLLVQRP